MVVQRLDDELAAQRARSAEKIPADKQALMEQATRELEAEAWRMGLTVGEGAPDFKLQSVQGEDGGAPRGLAQPIGSAVVLPRTVVTLLQS